jgi:ATPase family associated with various cellular activities (AAA)
VVRVLVPVHTSSRGAAYLHESISVLTLCDLYCLGDAMARGRKYPRVVSASHSNRRQPQWDANCDPSGAEAGTGVGAAVGQRNRVSAIRSNIRIDMDAEKGERDFIIGTPLMRMSTGRPVGNEEWTQSDEEVAKEEEKEREDEDEEGNVGRGVVIIAATNRLEDIDPAVVRRFESRVYVGVPEHDTRMAMVTAFLRYGMCVLIINHSLALESIDRACHVKSR